MVVTGTHDTVLVLLSVSIAVIASYTALDLATRMRASEGRVRRFWLTGAAVAMGGGIWSMHFVAMLALNMPGMAFTYDPWLTALSFLLALAFTGAGFSIMYRWSGSAVALAAAGLLTGLGVVAMHYLGMAAMRMSAALSYQRLWVSLSVLIAIGAATAALWIASRDRRTSERVAAAGLMGLAVSGMHYTGMRAAVFTAASHVDMAQGESSVSQSMLAIGVTGTTLLILLLGLGAASIDRRFAAVRRREARVLLRLQLADAMRDTGTDEALHNTAALMGEHFGVQRVGYGQADAAEDMFDYRICWTDGSVPPLLGRHRLDAPSRSLVAQLAQGRTVAIEDLATVREDVAGTGEEVETRAILVVPFLQGGKLKTIVYLNSRAPRRWSADEIQFMEELAERTRQVIARAEVEAELRELNATLEARIEERTAALRSTEAALRQSQKMEAIGQLTGGIAHDFNNMLTGVIGGLDIIKRRIAAGRLDDLDRFIDAATSSAQRAAALTARLLAFARRQSLDSRPTDINAVARSLEDLLVRTMNEQIAVEIVTDEALPLAVVDAHQLESAILNLAINARDAMPNGGRLRVETGCRDAGDAGLDAGRYVAVTVRDTGTGMDAETREKAFEPFFTTKPIGKGTGLGLSMVYGFAQQSGGGVEIDSAPGRGTAVTILLPASDRATPHAPEAAVDTVAPIGAGRTVLLVEDEEAVRMLVRNLLEDWGFAVREAGEAEAAIGLLATGPAFDLMITDVGLPGRTGRELAEIARRHQPRLPILFITGYAEDARERGDFLGPDMQMILKPFTVDTLTAKINEMLGQDPAPEPLRAAAG